MRTKQFHSERAVTLLGWIQADVASLEATLYSCLQTAISADASRVETVVSARGLFPPAQFKQEATATTPERSRLNLRSFADRSARHVGKANLALRSS